MTTLQALEARVQTLENVVKLVCGTLDPEEVARQLRDLRKLEEDVLRMDAELKEKAPKGWTHVTA